MVGAIRPSGSKLRPYWPGAERKPRPPRKYNPIGRGAGGGCRLPVCCFCCFVHHSASMESDMHELNSGSIVTRVSPLAAQTFPHGCRAENGVSFPRRWRRAGVAEPVSTVHLAHLPLWRIPAGSARQLLSCWSRKNVIQARPFLALPGVQPGVWIASDPRGIWQRPRTWPFSPDHFITFVQGLFI